LPSRDFERSGDEFVERRIRPILEDAQETGVRHDQKRGEKILRETFMDDNEERGSLHARLLAGQTEGDVEIKSWQYDKLNADIQATKDDAARATAAANAPTFCLTTLSHTAYEALPAGRAVDHAGAIQRRTERSEARRNEDAVEALSNGAQTIGRDVFSDSLIEVEPLPVLRH
jgi:hypothetical protein